MIPRPLASLLLLLLTSRSSISATAESFETESPDATFGHGFAVLPPSVSIPDRDRTPAVKPSEHEFTLRHIFHRGAYQYPKLHRRLDVSPDASVFIQKEGSNYREPLPKLRAKSESLQIQRLADRDPARVNSIIDRGRISGQAVSLPPGAWTVDEVTGPNVTDKETVLSFARIAGNAYVTGPDDGEWEPVGGGFNYTEDFGWENDGLRGHIFADTENKTVVIGLKGTSPAVFDGSETTTNDKINDNLFFSCCCGQGGQYLWKQVCDCKTSAFTCNSTCLVKSLNEKNRYYYAAQDLYHNVTALYPDADIWMAGHSLGGAVSSLLALTYGLPCITYEAPAEAMAASRLGLPVPPGYNLGYHQERLMTGGYHFGQTADPIFMGTCNGAYSGCTLGGYAMESVCHTGQVCIYDTVSDNGWRVGIGNHRIKSVIHDVIQKYDAPPKCEPYGDCTDCFNWEYFESNGSETTTTTTSTSTSTTRTRTTTCKTPGWWGCLDETTTSNISTTTTTTSTSTSTCETPGWFGCKDSTTTTTTTSEDLKTSTAAPAPTITTTSTVLPTSSSSSSSSTCETPGWFGCNDPTTTTSPSSTARSAHSTSSCRTPGWFGCRDPQLTATATRTVTSTIAAPRATCRARHWWGTCRDWDYRPQPPVLGLKEEM